MNDMMKLFVLCHFGIGLRECEELRAQRVASREEVFDIAEVVQRRGRVAPHFEVLEFGISCRRRIAIGRPASVFRGAGAPAK